PGLDFPLPGGGGRIVVVVIVVSKTVAVVVGIDAGIVMESD
ncbi:hypothetical protein Tco_0632089, partial [Tanacetum coccineum]